MASRCLLVVDLAQFHHPCAVLYAPETRVVVFRAVPTLGLSMDTTSSIGRMVARLVLITSYCSAGTIITWCMRVALLVTRKRTARSRLMTNESSRSISHQDYRVLPPTMTFSNGSIVSSSMWTSTARPALPNGMPGREWIGRLRCRHCSDIARQYLFGCG